MGEWTRVVLAGVHAQSAAHGDDGDREEEGKGGDGEAEDHLRLGLA